ncbi:LOW QUALITY PROTEIN: receptor-type tyrosine-protein phosphatase T-like [Chelonus insularis]|uniref:LOW QUALITY PROTEIN: receptor-type tyrosine-protein phosphatase T-like n=1 Tax=Chelonus insularis TaxID=460826 RepID=UPI00158D355A|nr:LOW QUALITY PROTEIN: receptor-type tyrosine-protein phosphatase T-like [Chelonus insularis]
MNLACFIIINLFIQLVSSSHLTIFRDEPKYLGYTRQMSRQLLCVSDRPKDAIVWNTNLYWIDENLKNSDRKESTDTKLSRFTANYEQQMRINVDKMGFNLWGQEGGNWSIVDSCDIPMGPVYDSRWEGFTDFESSTFKPIKIKKNGVPTTLKFGATGSLAFSIRGRKNAHILICESEKFESDFCYWIIIGGWENTISGMRKCENGVPWEIPPNNSPCRILQNDYRKMLLSSDEWKTFVLTWEEETRKIQLFNPDKKILHYSDYDKIELKQTSNNSYYIFYRNPTDEMLFRYHDYNYTLTTDRGAILRSSPLISGNSPDICIDMLVGLCYHCNLIVSIIDGDREKGTAICNLEEADPMKDHWAITNFENCLPEGTSNSSEMEMTATQDYASGYLWPSVSCQRLSYEDPKSEVLEAINVLPTSSNNFEICKNFNFGPNCEIKCSSFSEFDCYGVEICTKLGCSCAQRIIRPYLSNTQCSQGLYGFGCSKKCSNCSLDSCDRYSGECLLGCKLLHGFHSTNPYCDQDTSARVFLYEEENYKLINAMFEFEAETDHESILREKAHTKINIINGTEKSTFFAIFNDLLPGTKYEVKAVMHIQFENNKYRQLVGSPASFITLCNFYDRIKKSDEVLTIFIFLIVFFEFFLQKKIFSLGNSYPCPDSWYSIDLSIISPTTNESRPVHMNDTEIKFPITLSNLHPLTEYQVCINGSDNEFRDCQILSTLEAAPPPVTNLQEKSVTATGVEILWNSPEPSNGVILGYNLTIKVLYYIGCKSKQKTPENLKISKTYSNIAPTTEVIYELKNLVPYVFYEVSVSAYNSRVGNKNSFIFSTKPRDIPTEVFTNIKFSHNQITWDNPVDCWTITGPIDDSRVVITGVSENVKNFYYSYDTKSHFVNLNLLKAQQIYGNEKYRAEIYVLRGPDRFINISAHIDSLFTTDPSPPPKVQNLEIVEIDESNTTLRWQQPSSPMNGELDYYSIRFLGRNERLLSEVKVHLNETCYLWKNSLCKTVPHPTKTIKQYIEVRAHNKGVNNPGESFKIVDNREEQTPEQPEIISVTEINKGVVYVKWQHPSITGGPIKQFVIIPKIIDTELKNYPYSKNSETKNVPISKYEPEYSTYLYLQPSTRYTIFIQGKTATQSGKQSQEIIETACALDFQYKPHPVPDNDTSLINIVIPPIVNNTKDSKLHIIVKGPSICKQGGTLSEQMAKDIEVDYHEVAWRVATFPSNKTANLSFTIGDDHIYDGVSNCPLNVGSTYVIVILVHDKTHSNKAALPLIWKSEPIQIGRIPKIHHESWAIPVVLIVLIIGGTMYYCLLKKRNKEYFDKTQSDEMTEPIPIYPIVPEKKNRKSEHINEAEDISNMVDIRESISITPSNSTERLNRTIATESIYENLKGNSSIRINEFQDYVKQAIATGKLDLQYEILRRGQTKPWKYGIMPQNKSKNRYGNLIAYDETRVILEKLPDDPYSDYINANYIQGYNNEKAYIATQGPKPNTLIDFWRMIWQEEILVICMLANIIEGGKIKCEQYWPEIGKEIKYGKITVGNISHTVFADYSFRTFHVTFGQKSRKIRQLHFTAWPDHGVPLYTQSVVSYLKKLLATPTGNGPILVHCSAGVGRTGTIIVCDICLRRAAGEGVIDVFGETEMMRNQRANMVDNKQQYLLAHLALVECLLALPTSIPCNDNLPSNIQEFKNQLTLQQQRLEESTWQDRALQPLAVSPKLSEANLAKNRFPELAPLSSRIYISRYPTTEDDSNYITGVYVDSARKKNNYIASQLPLPNTVGDFWRMVVELKVELIVLLQPVDLNDETCGKFIPKPDEEMKPVPFITLKGKSIADSEIYLQQRVILANSLEKCGNERTITILTCKDWKPGKNKSPPKPAILVDLWQSAERISRSEEPTLVLCYDGVTGCGLYLALSFLLERMGLERECDVCLAIRAIRRSRSDFCKSIDQFAYLYDAAAVYSDYFETYANFT